MWCRRLVEDKREEEKRRERRNVGQWRAARVVCSTGVELALGLVKGATRSSAGAIDYFWEEAIRDSQCQSVALEQWARKLGRKGSADMCVAMAKLAVGLIAPSRMSGLSVGTGFGVAEYV